MKTQILSLWLLLASGLSAASDSGVSIIGSVARPGAYELTAANNTLSSLLEAAGALLANGSDKIGITITESDGTKRAFQVDGTRFYTGDRDYFVTLGTVIFISECVGLGLGGLSDRELERMNKERAEYLERKKYGENPDFRFIGSVPDEHR